MNEGGSKGSGKEDAPSALQSAADDLRRNAGADQPTPSGTANFGTAFSRQSRGLFDWARGSNLLLKGADLLARSSAGGQEHRILESVNRQRYVKITHPDEFGLYPEPIYVLDKSTQKLVPSFRLRKALPAEYLDRLQRQNELFGDDQQLHGVFVDENKHLRTVISQTALKGKPPTKQEIYDVMGDAGFEVVRSGGSRFFYRPDDNTAVFDAHEGNFLKTSHGVLPFDVITIHPQGKLLAAIHEARGTAPDVEAAESKIQ